ncbi:MAG TPA: PadR family transcriptional regulator [Streptosporangiaceae bacterium]|jgi:DNA-binding PadR family transcriptional regulator|nr:PadR family transcriptional regulator [Streptosporangiaceae bacterium]
MATLGYALLGLLARKPRTGYELTQALRAPIGYFWTASHSQVYPELARLETDGLVHYQIIDGPGPRDTKRYTITAAGLHALATWAVTPAPPERSRSEFLLKVYSLWLAEPTAARALVAGERQEHRAMLTRYEQLATETERGRLDPADPLFCDRATLRRGLSFERHVIAWCDWLLDALTPHTRPRAQQRQSRRISEDTSGDHAVMTSQALKHAAVTVAISGNGDGRAVNRTLHVGEEIQISGVTVRLTSIETVTSQRESG